MLGTDRAKERLRNLWRSLDCKVELPEGESQFLSVKGVQASGLSDERQYPRYIYRNQAFLQHTGKWSAIYAKDLSHSSVGFVHSRQLFPCDEIQVCFLNGTKIDVTIERCRRLSKSCYECGGHIDEKSRLSTQAMRKLIQERGSEAGE
jgi:hypothetical protein